MLGLNVAGMSNLSFLISHQSLFTFACVQIRHNPLSGGYCGGVPPLPIPNREVKPTCADGTAMQCGRVGRRLLSMKSLRFRKISEAFLFFFPRIFFFSAVFFFSLNISLSRRFRRWRRFFLIDYFSPTDFTDSHRFFSLIIFLMDLHGFSLFFFLFLTFLLFSCYFFISQILDLSVWDRLRRLFSQIIFLQILWKISLVFFFHLFVFCL